MSNVGCNHFGVTFQVYFLYVILFFSDFTGVISMRYYMCLLFSGLLSVQAFLSWSPVKLVY